jgi:hypothetical protein
MNKKTTINIATLKGLQNTFLVLIKAIFEKTLKKQLSSNMRYMLLVFRQSLF